MLAGLFLALGMTRQAPALHFETASIKPADPAASGSHGWGWKGPVLPGGEFSDESCTGEQLVEFALPGTQIVGLPGWARFSGREFFAVEAKPDRTSVPSTEEVRKMMLALLQERFGLRFHTESRKGPVFWLEVAKGGPKNLTPEPMDARPGPPFFIYQWSRAVVFAHAVTMQEFANALALPMRRPVLDKTGLPGRYSIVLAPGDDHPLAPGTPRPDGAAMILDLLRHSLGLDLRAGEGASTVVIVDRFERPTPN